MKKWSWGYELLKPIVVFWHYLFYKEIIVLNLDKVPQNKPVVFAPNHQNALMDALAISCTCKMQPVFLARADIFKNPVSARILNFLRIMPVYRIRDGKEALSGNDEIFNKSMSVLENGGSMAIFPEANHAGFRHLRVLKKGIPRIVFQAEERNDFNLGVKIVPVGIYYSNYPNMKSILIVNYGEAFEVAPFNNQYKENHQKGMLALRNEIAEKIRPLIIDVPDMEHNDYYEQTRELYDHLFLKHLNLKPNAKNKLNADQHCFKVIREIHEKQPETFIKLKEKTKGYFESIKSFDLQDSLFDNQPKSTLQFILIFVLLLISAPVHFYGFVMNYLPYTFIDRFVKNKIKDVQFRSSFIFVLGLILYPIWFFVITGIANFWFDNILYYWLVFFSIPVSGLFTLNNWIRFKKTLQELKYARLAKSGLTKFNKVISIRKELISEIKESLQ
ncbi:MAG: 1-acyl-sn-glycerol-3-phosphate acyltransferase [Bacteroidota bacterium]|nr:1-acyl-sn-glycerol-3-phosphate acyltransferase [Bacteroidota bacterium]